ncbi:MAG: cytochrome c oxidase assembly protein [Nocardioides sp.]
MSPFTPASLLGAWEFNPLLFGCALIVLALYARALRVLQARGDHWPMSRSLAFVAGVWLFLAATSSGIAAYDTILLSVHMAQHMMLSMLVPVLLALGAPVTLALRTLSARPRRALTVVLHARVARVLTFAPLTLALYILSPWLLYFTGWYEASLRSELIHEATHVHLVVIGSLFMWPLIGTDPVPGRVGYPFRLLMVLLTLPFHAFLGVTIMGSTENGAGRDGNGALLAWDWYAGLRTGPMAEWLPTIAADQRLAGGILWAAGDLIGAVLFAVLFAQWWRASGREARRIDRGLDLAERRARTGGGPTVDSR